MCLNWAEHLSVGNRIIDSDHKNLIVVVNRLANAIRSRDRAALAKTFELLDTYMSVHFRNEEKIAEAIEFPFEKNKVDQRQLMHEMRYMVRELESMDSYWPDHLLHKYSRFLSSWLIDHIIKTDMKMKPALQAYPYEFRPE